MNRFLLSLNNSDTEQKTKEAIILRREYCLSSYQKGQTILIAELSDLVNVPFKGAHVGIRVNLSFVLNFLLEPGIKVEENYEKDQLIFIKEKCN